jgi:type VI secretion system secreted protein Hcp
MDVILLKIPGIEGESQLKGFEKSLEALSFTHGVAMQIHRRCQQRRTNQR